MRRQELVGRKGWLPVDDGATMAEYKSKSRAPSFLSRFSPTTPHPSIPFNPFYIFLSLPILFLFVFPLLSIFPISCVPLHHHHHRNRPLFYFLPSCLAPRVYRGTVENSIFLPITLFDTRLVLFPSLNLLPSLSAIICFTPRPNWTHFIIRFLAARASPLIAFPLLF